MRGEGADRPRADRKELRRRAEARLRQFMNRIAPDEREEGDTEEEWFLDIERVVHELEVHQVELEMQNEELRRAHEELENAHARYRELFEVAPVGYLGLDAEARISEANRPASALLGDPIEGLTGRPLARFLDQHDADRLHLHLRELEEAPGETRSIEVTLRRPDGRATPVLLESVAILGRGRPGWRTALVDLTEKRRTEAELRDSLRRFHDIADRIHDVFYVAETGSGRLLYVSPAFEAVFGRPAADALAAGPRGWLRWVHPDDRARVEKAAARARSGAPTELEYRILRPDGAVRSLRDRSFPVPGEVQTTGVAEDVTQERRLERELEMRHVQKMEAVGTLATGIAHDFNNLLMGLIGFADLALSQIDASHPAHHFVARFLGAAERGTSLTRRLLAFTRKRSAEPRTVPIDATVIECQDLLQPLLGAHIRWRVVTSAPGVHVLADPDELEQVLLNLATNARDAMSGGGELVVRTAEEVVPAEKTPGFGVDTRCAVLVVSDTGDGMDEATRGRIFEPFFTTKEVGKGTGLGLATVFAIVKRLEGMIEVETEVGRGSTFRIYLPAAEPPPIARAPGHGATAASARKRVLLVEDEELVRSSLELLLETLGYEVVSAAGPDEAMALVTRDAGPIDALVTDVIMPGRLGTRLAEEITARIPTLPVLFISAHPREELVTLAGLRPCDRLLEKPFGVKALEAAVAELLACGDRLSPAPSP